MATKTTHTFKTISNLQLKADIYIRTSSTREFPRSQPILLYFHGGGFVASNREDLPPHIVQLCLRRNWILVSADYRKLPRVSGRELWEDARDAFLWAREALPGVLTGRTNGAKFENLVVMGRSSGAYLAYLLAHNISPKPIALLTYYGITSMSDPFFTSNFQLGPSPIAWERVQPFFNEEVTCGSTPASKKFDPECLLPSLTRNPAWQRPEAEPAPNPRMALVPWVLQENQFSDLMKEVDRDLEDASWRTFPPSILVHGDLDRVAPYDCSVRLVEAIGQPPAKLFTAVGRGHAFDEALFSGDLGLEVVEEAWITLDEAVKARL